MSWALLLGMLCCLGGMWACSEQANTERRRRTQVQAELEAIQRERNIALCNRQFVVSRVGDLSEGTLSPQHAEDIADWMRAWF